MEDEQNGAERAGYGKNTLKELSNKLLNRYGKGWTVENLTLCRKFYNTYSNFVNTDYEIENQDLFKLSWSHYLVLMRIKKDDERKFYEIECHKQNWSVRQLQRHYNFSLYERLALSRNKSEEMRLASEGQTLEKPSDIIKNPLTLEFLGLREELAYTESKLENAIIDKLQDFLLELGKGFLFDARQKRSTLDEVHYYVDLVFDNRLLQY